MPGRRPTPTKLKLIRGNPGHRSINADEPEPEPGIPEAPDNLSDDGRNAWGRLARTLDRMGVLTEADSHALERLAECYAEILECQRAIEAHGRTYEAQKGDGNLMVRPRPEVGMLADADRRFKSYLVEFGLTPAARTKVRMNDETQDDLAEFFG